MWKQFHLDEKGYVRAGWNSYREFDNSNGGYYAGFGTPALSLNRDLILGYQKLWVELGWTPNPDALVELAYDFQVRDGEKSLLQWGLVSDPNFALVDRAIYPAFKGLREERHNIRISLRRQIEELLIADDFNIGFTKYYPVFPCITKLDNARRKNHFIAPTRFFSK